MKSFSDVCRFNCQVTNVFGYFFFSPSTTDSKTKQKSFSRFFKFAIYTILGLLASIKSSDVNTGNGSDSIIVTLGLFIIIQQTMFMPTVFRVFNYCVRHRHGKIIHDIQSIDEDLSQMGISINYQQHFLAAMTITALYFGFLFVTVFVDFELSSRYLEINSMDPMSIALAGFNIAAYLSYQLSHMLVVLSLYKRLRYMNEVLESKNINESRVRGLRRIHSKLCDTLDDINFCFTLNLLNFFSQFTFFSIFYLFDSYRFLTSTSRTEQEFAFNVITGCYLLFVCWFSAFMITISSWIKGEGKETALLIHSHVPKSSKHAKALSLFCMQINHKKPEISSGIFIVDWTFLFALISTLFSYLIILIQFESG